MKTPFRTLAATLALATLPATGFAQTAASSDPKAAQSGHYTIEPTHTQVVFTISHLGFTPYTGIFSQASGTLALDKTDPAHDKLAVSIPIASVMTTSTTLNKELTGPDWFDAGRYAAATFVSTKVTPTGPSTARIDGTLTLHGVRRPVTLAAHFMGAGINPIDQHETIGFDATTTVRRSDFGITKYLPVLGDGVTLSIAGAFEKY
ncbi:YceI family protein [Tanticharoenia sakaeratensis]|uniref:Lipid/polyisoprenoid-binding YceI-like domain-containing protein n=1 Tax=Tanticharoenia sakaeratensis NBRC 103193 TaxID=1231623 RepID=A0A0D6MGZ2_9PROT|nr:YceI family protein [Tanticharoenia sakaeratensis]GAN52761.1 hypothetical protein Tasa_002_041 [Tanticharoenia sakaeratensis NBRC 103193]GBQ17940.1 hypothetical protein AA103193_0526 [Tanticharoenia sakaeratensis NBRC 103193]